MSRINFKDTCYVASTPTYLKRPKDNLPEIVFIGRSNVGKSSLINALCSSRLAFPSKSAGKTKTLNYFLVNKRFYLVDSPGYGYTAYGNKEDSFFAKMMEPYFDNPLLKGVLLLVDVRRLMRPEEEDLITFIKEKNLPLIIVFTKCDNAKQAELSKARESIRNIFYSHVFFSKKGQNIEELRTYIAKLF